jgi:hypothetical protein
MKTTDRAKKPASTTETAETGEENLGFLCDLRVLRG